MADSQVILMRRESLRTHVPEPDTFTVACSECKRDLECDLDTDTWTYADDRDYYPISKPEETKLGVFCQHCWESMDEALVLAVLQGVA